MEEEIRAEVLIQQPFEVEEEAKAHGFEVTSEEEPSCYPSVNLGRRSLVESMNSETKSNFRFLYTKSLKFASEYDQQTVNEFKGISICFIKTDSSNNCLIT